MRHRLRLDGIFQVRSRRQSERSGDPTALRSPRIAPAGKFGGGIAAHCALATNTGAWPVFFRRLVQRPPPKRAVQPDTVERLSALADLVIRRSIASLHIVVCKQGF